jgi:serine/threonine protein kinase
MQLQPGTYLQGDKYRIIDILGNGGFGITYLAEHELAGRNVCIKEFFPKEYYNRDDNSHSISLGSKGSAKIMDAYKAKFMKEAKTIARLDHPNIIHIHDVFEENNTAYYVMEYIDGESLSTLVRERGALAEAEAIKYIRAVAEALGYIHDRKIMHLDIKPANVMLRKEDGRAILIDFGLSKQYDAEGNQTSSTPVGISAGYAPMEQYQQGGVREFSPETDIYSLGATLYYLVTGEVPPQAASVVDSGLPELPAHLSSGVRNAIEQSMEIQRRRRPHSIKEFLALLEDDTPKVVATPTPEPTPSPVSAPVSTPVDDKTSVTASAPVTDERTVVGAPAPKVQSAPQPKKERAPKYSAEKPKKSDEPKKKSKWWLWLLIVAIVAGVGAFFILNKSNQQHPNITEIWYVPGCCLLVIIHLTM